MPRLNTSTHRTILSAGLAGAALLTMISAPAALAGDKSSTLTHTTTNAGGAAAGAKSQFMSLQTDGGDSVQFKRDNNDYTITLNGKEIKKGSTETDDWSSFEVKNDKGEVIATIARNNDHFSIHTGEFDEDAEPMAVTLLETAPGDPINHIATVRGQNIDRLRARELGRAYAEAAASRPKVMMGVTMGQLSESLADHLGISAENATLIESVSDGLPASKAGLQRYDVVLKVDGKEPATESAIRETLRSKNPGDEMTFEVVRKGEHKTITMKLDAYDPAKLGTFGAFGGAYNLAAAAEENDTKLKELQGLAEQLNKAGAEAALKAGAAASEINAKHMQELAARMSELAKELAESESTRTFSFSGSPGTIRIDPGSGNGFVLPPMPAAPVAPGAAGGTLMRRSAVAPRAAEENARLDSRMKELDERLDRLEKLIEKLAEQKGAGAGN